MEKMLMAVFDTAPQALKGVMALRDLDRAGNIRLYTTAVIRKDASGEASIQQASEKEWGGRLHGLLIGILLGTWGGPIGVAIGASIGWLAGLVFDLAKAGVSADLLEEASNTLEPGKTALLAEIDEALETPVDIKLVNLGGQVFRAQRSQFVEKQLFDELDRIEAELNQP